ncbi:MAG: hypothetical protein ACTINM_05825 [Acetobacter cibinongensis]
MTDTRIEAVARALCIQNGHDPDGQDSYVQSGMDANWRAFEDDAETALRAADAAAWRPIETAPKDGSHIDLWVINSDDKGHRLTDVYFGPIPHTCGEYGKYCDSCPPEGDFWIDGIFGQQVFGMIIGWQPLPEPLVIDAGGANG